MSVTLHGRFAVSDTLSDRDLDAPVLSSDHSVRLNSGSTGTTLSASVSANSAGPVTHHTLSAEQQIYGPLHVNTALTDAGQPTGNLRVAAACGLSW